MAYMQNKQMPIRNYGALRNMMLAQNTAPNPYRSPAWMEQIAKQKALENSSLSEREIADRELDRFLMEKAPKATSQDLAEFGLTPQGRMTPDTFGSGSAWRELESLQPSGIDPAPYERELKRMMQERQNQSLRSPTPAEQENIRRSGNPFSNWKMHGGGNPFATPTDEEMNRYKSNQNAIWNAMKNWR